MDWQALLYLLPFLSSLAISTGVGLYAWRRRTVTGAGAYAVLALAEASWTLGFVLELLSPSLEAKIFWDNVQFVSMFVAPLALLRFALRFTGHRLSHPRRTWAALAIVSLAFLLLVFTDSLHGLIRPTAWLVPGEPFPALVYDFAIAMMIMAVYVCGLLMYGLYLLARSFIRAQPLYRAQIATILVGLLIPWAGSLLTLLDLAPTFHRDMTPFTFAFGNLIVVWGLFRYRLFDAVPVARDMVIENLRDAVVMLDAQDRVVDLNPAARRVVGGQDADVIGQPVSQVFSKWLDLVERFYDAQEMHTEITIDVEGSQRHFEFSLSPIRDWRGRSAGRLIVVHDITERKRAKEDLQQAHDQLELRIQESLAELQAANQQLQQEIAERARVEEEIRRRTAQLEALHQLGLEIAAQLDLDALLHSIVSRAVELTGGYGGGINLYQADRQVLEVVMAVGLDPAIVGTAVRPGEGVAGRVWESGQPLTIEDYQSWAGHSATYEDFGLQAVVAVPIRWGERFLGVLNVTMEIPHAFSPSETELLSLFATQAAIAIENARLYDQARRHNRELILLNWVIAASAASQEIEPILEIVCRELARAFDLPHVLALLLDEEKTGFGVVAEYTVGDGPFALGQVIPLADGPLANRLLEHTGPLIVDDVQADPDLAPLHDLLHQQDIASLLFWPILIAEEVMGVLLLGADEPRPFSPGEVALIQRVAEQVSGALARAHLARTQQRLSAAVEQSAESVLITDTETTILYANPAVERLTGCGRAELLGQKAPFVRYNDQDLATHKEQWEAALSRGQAWQGKFTSRRKDGSRYVAEATIAPMRNRAGESVNYVITMRDVTREMQLEEQSRQAQRMEALGRLAGGIAHDFNNLLTVIQLSTRLLERKLHAPDPLWDLVQQIRETGDRAANLTRQLLRFSRRDIVEPRPLDLNAIVEDLQPMLQRLIGEHIEQEISLAGDLWLIEADPSQMEQVLVNLAVNARDAMPEGGTLHIETANVTLDEAYAASHMDAQPGEHVLLAVSDTGIGISDEVRAHIFEPFFTTKERGKSTGLGLSTVFGIVKQGGGHIQVDSEIGRGTTFRAYLPRAATPVAVHPAPGGERTGLAAQEQGTETILIVEDDSAVRGQSVRVLQAYGYQLLTAKDGRDALRVSQEYDGPIHLLLTDVIMPQMGGPELAEHLQAQRPEMCVLFMSGYTDETIAHQGVLPEGIALLPKPFTIEGLTRQVRAVLDGEH